MTQSKIKSDKNIRQNTGAILNTAACGSHPTRNFLSVGPSDSGICEYNPNEFIFIIDLNSLSVGYDISKSFTRGDSATQLATNNVTITYSENSEVETFTIIISNVLDGASEILSIGSSSFPLNANKSATEIVGSTTFAIDYTTLSQTFSITNNAGGNMPLSDLITFIESLLIENTGSPPTYANRTISLKLTANSTDSNTAIITLSIIDQAPIIDEISNDSTDVGSEIVITPTYTGGVPTLWEATGLSDGATINPSTGVITWTPTIATTLNIIVTASNSGGTDNESFSIISNSLANNPPVVDLNGGGAGINASLTFTEGDESTYAINSATLSDADGDGIVSITIIGTSGFGNDGADEQIEFSTEQFPSNADNSTTLVVGSTTFALDFTTIDKTLIVTNNAGGTFTATDGQAFLRLFAYWNQAVSPTLGDRLFTVVANDGTDNSTTATLTVSVVTNALTIDLGGTNGNYDDYFVITTAAVNITNGSTVSGSDPTTCTITLAGFTDGDDEEIIIGSTAYPAATDDAGSATVGSTTFDVDFTSGIFTITKNGGGTIPAADLETLLDGITVESTAWPFTKGDRTLSVSLDGGAAKIATITYYIAELPREYVDTTYSLPTGGTTHYPADATELQTAFDSAALGDVIVLDKDTIYQGNFTLDERSGTGWLYVVSSGLASLPAEGTRINPTYLADTATMRSPTYAAPALTVDKGTKKVRFVGIDFTTAHATTGNKQYGVVRTGYDNGAGYNAEDIIFDRCLIRGTPTGDVRDGMIVYEVTRFAITECYVCDIHVIGDESHGVQVYNTSGPSRVTNNYIESAAINLFVGDNGNVITPEDVEIRYNHLYKPRGWDGDSDLYNGINWSVKNIFEIKSAHRVLFEGNVLENVWPHSQLGQAILLTPRASEITDVTIRNNYVLGNYGGAALSDADAYLRRVDWHDVVMNGVYSATGRYGYSIGGAVTDDNWIRVANTTTSLPGASGFITHNAFGEDNITYLDVADNISTGGAYGIYANGIGSGYTGVAYHCAQFSYLRNILVGTPGGDYSDHLPEYGDFSVEATFADVDFVDETFDDLADFALDAASSYKGTSPGGTDPGANVTSIAAALLGTTYDANISAPTIYLGGNGIEDVAVEWSESVTPIDIAASAFVIDWGERFLTTLTIVVTGELDGDSETINIGGTDFPLGTDMTDTGTGGSTTFAIAYIASTNTFTITKSGGGNLNLVDTETLISEMTYINSANTAGNRDIVFQTSDGTFSGNSATATITVLASDNVDNHLRKQSIAIQSAKIDADLTDFTVYVTRDMLDDEVVDPSDANRSQADGGDVRFSTDAAGTNLIPCKIIQWEYDSSTGAGDANILAAVKVPSILAASGATIYVWYSTSGTTSQPAAASDHGADNAFDANFYGFYPSASSNDETANGFNLTATGSPTEGGASGPLGLPATTLNGSSQYLSASSGVPTSYPLTLIGWFNPNNATTEYTMMSLGLSSSLNIRVGMRASGTTVGDPVRGIEYAGAQENCDSTAGFTASTWNHGALVFAATNNKASYLNGNNKGTSTAQTTTSASPDRFAIGCQLSNSVSGHFAGSLAFCEIHTAARSDAWIKAGYEMISDPTGFGVAGTPTDT